jgi:hypothetical protein
MAKHVVIDVTGTALDASTPTIGTVQLEHNCDTMIFELENAGAVALDAFVISLQAYPGADFVQLLAAYAAEGNHLLFVSAALNTLAATSKATAVVKLHHAHAVRFAASGNAADCTVNIQGVAWGDE